EHVHWLFATGFLLLGLCLIGEAIVGTTVWRRRAWRAYLWPGLAFGLGVFMWPVMTFYTNSAIHMLAHGAWAQMLMIAGAAELGLTFVVASVMLYSDRDVAPVFGHISPLAGRPHR